MQTNSKELDLASFRARLEAIDGPKYWRSLEELTEDENFREMLGEEFPQQAYPMPDGTDRRSFMKIMGASFAMAGLAACRAPYETIVPYVQKPEEIIPGKPLFFATSMVLSGVATGLLVESHEGRPTKVEGNPQHPASLGATDSFHQASVLGLYDPDRSDSVRYLGEVSTWSSFLVSLQQNLEPLQAGGGAGLRILTETITSPSTGNQIRNIINRFPQAVWHQWEPSGASNAREGARAAFGSYAETVYDFTRANVIVSLDSDVFGCGPGHLRYSRDFASRRRVSGGQTNMNRLYAVGPQMNVTASIADNRLPLKASEIEPFARALAGALGAGGAGGEGAAPQNQWIAALAKDLAAHRGASIVIAGDGQPPVVHAIAHAINQALGNVGSTVRHLPSNEVLPVNQLHSLNALVSDMNAGRVRALLVLEGNPVFNAPADLEFVQALDRVPFRVHLSSHYDETSERCHWHIPEAHYLESWGDARAFDGTLSIVQPLIAPLYNGRTMAEVLGAVVGDLRTPHDILRDYWRANVPEAATDEGWRRILHDGFINRPQPATSFAAGAVPPAMPRQAGGDLEIIFTPDPTIHDGRFANNAWLQELPKPMTKTVWENLALLSPATARRLGLEATDRLGGANADLVEIQIGGRKIQAPIWIIPGQADDTVIVQYGYGRSRVGRVGEGIGYNAYAVRTSAAMDFATGAEIRKVGSKHAVACTQGHQRMEERQPVRVATLAQYAANPDVVKTHAELSGKAPDLYPEFRYDEYRWAMSIDTSVCVGCNGCVVACQAENNIPVVGKKEVLRQREMHWLRIDRYYEGGDANPAVYHQPVPCMHCEKAPCEPVCPVQATSHSDDGLNDMTYNRCIGTRYCSNNCPYKVRRFNFFGYADFETESLKLQRNPDVTVRSRGVMEKCTFCVQRVREGRRQAEKEGRRVRDGEIMTACQAACPTQAIVFGDLNDPNSQVSRLKKTPLDYGLLTELNTQPRTTYLATVRNPNPELPAGRT
jgi:MoCo/4Fe-4S cofactor protein with predicted Tat translocation signal